MGEKTEFQPLTTTDRITVLLYRVGIVLSSINVCVLGYLYFMALPKEGLEMTLPSLSLLAFILCFFYFGTGLSVFFIHLYIGKLYRFLKKVYYAASVCLVILVIMGRGNPVSPLLSNQASMLLLVPVAFCLGFVTAKEAFCFRLYEGYLLFALMPLYLIVSAAGLMSGKEAFPGIVSIALLLVFFTIRKVFMPLHYDIGDKSAYRP